MLKLVLSFVALATFIQPATAACDFLLVEIQNLTRCAQTQQLAIADQAREIELLRKQIEYLVDFRERDWKTIRKLSDGLFELRTQVVLLESKIPIAKEK